MGISVGSVSVDVVPSARGFSKELQAQLADQSVSVRAKLDENGVNKELDVLARDRELTLDTKLDDRSTKTELDTLTRTRTAKVKVDDGGSVGQTDRKFHALLTTLAAVTPAAAPITAVAIGGAAALAGLGAAGILAFKGIQNEMKAGTPIGVQYTGMLGELSKDLHGLEKTAATDVLAGFTASAHEAHAAMPALRTEVGLLATSLGSDLGPVTSGVLGLFHDLAPEINSIAGDAHAAAVGFDNWANGPGGRKFAEYLAEELPKVTAALEAIIAAGSHVVQALLPLGGPVLKGIEGIADAIHAIPVPIITDLFTAFLAYKSIILTQKAIEGVTGALVKLGLVEKAVGAGAGVKGAVSTGGLLGKAGRALSVSNLSEGSALGAAGVIGGTAVAGIGLGALGDQLLTAHGQKLDNKAASKIVAGGTAGFNAAKATQGVQIAQLTGLQQLQASQFKSGDSSGALSLTPKIQQLQTKVHDLGVALSLANPQIVAMQAANKAAGLTANGASDAITGEAVSLAQLVAANDKLATANQTNISTSIAWHQALTDANKALKDNGATLDTNTQKGRDNQTALLNLGTALRAHIDAEAAAGTSTQEVNAILSTSEDRLIKVAEKFGLSATQARHYADQVLGLPATASVKFTTPGLAAALRGVTTLNSLLESAYTLGGQAGAAAARAAHGSFGASGVPNVVIPSSAHPTGPGGAPAPAKKKKRAGGAIWGEGTSTSDSIALFGSNGEYMLQESAAAAIGYANLDKINAMGPHAYIPAIGSSAGLGHTPTSTNTGQWAGGAGRDAPMVNVEQVVVKDVDEMARVLTEKQRDVNTLYQLTGS